jgi:hypothetical protein
MGNKFNLVVLLRNDTVMDCLDLNFMKRTHSSNFDSFEVLQ